MFNQYFDQLRELMNLIEREERDSLLIAAEKIADCILKEGIVHVFGCGHSHMLAEEAFYRAGGLAPINPILDEDVMLSSGAIHSSNHERKNDFAQTFIKDYDIRPNDIVIVASTSGVNPVPIDVARFSNAKGAFVIVITSLQYPDCQQSRHESGQYLFQNADLIINNHISVGDALIHSLNLNLTYGPGSTIIGMMILNGMIVEATSLLIEQGEIPPIIKSGNIDGADQFNKNLIEKYKKRIPLLNK